MLLIRRIAGDSMLPGLKPGSIVIAIRTKRNFKIGDVIVVQHNGMEKIKRIADIKDGKVYLLGDNSDYSSDSRHFGWLDSTMLIAKLIWPRTNY
jgi:nickel-type superoxide dismutase maturation protease